MHSAILFRGSVSEAGQFVPDDRVRWAAAVAKLRSKRVWVTVEKERRVRSLSANRYYWGWFLAILSEYTGHTSEELHDALKRKILGEKETPFGSVAKRGTHDMDETEFADYVSRCKAEAAFIGCNVPEPDEAGVSL